MERLAYDNLLVWMYLVVWLLTCIWYHYKRMTIDAGSTIIIAYVLYAYISIKSINDPIFSMEYKPLKIFPYIYLYVMMMIALAPPIYYHLHPSTTLEAPNTRTLHWLGWLIIICAILLIPGIMENGSGGISKLLTDSDAGKDAYNEALRESKDSGSAIRNLPAIIYNSMSDLSTFLLFFFLTQKKRNKLLIGGLFLSMFVGIAMPLMQGQRGGVIVSVSTAIVGYLIFRPYINKAINRIIQIVGAVCLGIIAIPIIAITISRFGNESAGVNSYLNWYIGQGSLYFNNYALDDGGIRYGDRTLNLFKRVIDPETSKNFNERREKYHNLEMNDEKFTTFVGDFTIDFGPTCAFVIFLLFNIWVLLKIRTDGETIKLHQLLLIFFCACVSIQGGMSLFTFADTSNLRIITIFSLYAYLRYHEVLLEKFPLNSESDVHREIEKRKEDLL